MSLEMEAQNEKGMALLLGGVIDKSTFRIQSKIVNHVNLLDACGLPL